jgi:16S rRNA (cytosine1402-N4)-methyltransferase
MNIHEPVLLNESIDNLITKRNGAYFEGTAGFGGHSQQILQRLTKTGRLIAVDKDYNAFSYCTKKFKDDKRFVIYNSSFTEIDVIKKIEFIEQFDGIFADLGVSSFQLDDVESGFMFREDSPLDLRMNKAEGRPASDFLNNAEYDELASVIYNYGEEKNSRTIARKIIELRSKEKLQSSAQIKRIIEQITPGRFLNKTLSRVFQALRIYVNNELEEIEQFITKSIPAMKKGARIVMISFHSLEDRIVKEKFKYEAAECVCPPGTPICICGKIKQLKIITPKPVIPNEIEVKNNPRARSAKLRVAEKI